MCLERKERICTFFCKCQNEETGLHRNFGPDFRVRHPAENEDDNGGLVLGLGQDVRGHPLQLLGTGFRILDETGLNRFASLVERPAEFAGVEIQIRVPARFPPLETLETFQAALFSIWTSANK